jgi:hypothetical protein
VTGNARTSTTPELFGHAKKAEAGPFHSFGAVARRPVRSNLAPHRFRLTLGIPTPPLRWRGAQSFGIGCCSAGGAHATVALMRSASVG